MPLSVVGKSMSWGEALRLTRILTGDPESHVAAALSGWAYPVPRQALVLMDLYDLQHHVAWRQGGGKGSRPKPYPRPIPDRSKKTLRPDKSVTQAQIIAALRFAGHAGPVPA